MYFQIGVNHHLKNDKTDEQTRLLLTMEQAISDTTPPTIADRYNAVTDV